MTAKSGDTASASIIGDPYPAAGVMLDGAKQLFDNTRVTVWDIVWGVGQAGLPQHLYDTCTIALTAGAVNVTGPDGVSKTVMRKVGDVLFERKGAGHREEASGNGTPPRTIVIELKEAVVPPLLNKSGYPNAFPRPGGIKVMENDRIVVWDYTWTPGNPTPMHFHEKDVVVTYLEDGVLASTTSDGQRVDNPHYFGFAKFNPRDRTHTETLVKGKARAIITELK
jgi:hypothetical protein